MDENDINKVKQFSAANALISGAIAGMSVDLVLFPLDTIKTRLQSESGFWNSGGFRRIYSGLGSTMVGSAPGAAVFFCTYEMSKRLSLPYVSSKFHPFVHMSSAAMGEVMACLIRVPVEVVKQRAQAMNDTSYSIMRKTLSSEGFKGFYRGYFATVMREIPFSLIQFPMWEFLKNVWSKARQKRVEPIHASICGAIAGGISAFITTPLDVAKTRIMLADKNSIVSTGDVIYVLRKVKIEKGFRGLYSGAVPRVLWISLGGAIFLGGYEKFVNILESKQLFPR